ncbi:hypothetical protein QTQ03_26570 [Micromonospora sp. WMMA1363]|uniref:hypothetical protein n=1 Tax=Micromonospora sp. WMMA1363 TaxID=3053985 RepID=UPI00259CF155|nr:hypothetical protein [Micromonospora sp. WMMA1363]MDM4720133.1 hypothetical protein [Micromonospora sp. WMMA1363]MDM4722993.1 hypothetical protein [Micromonospora sp. WMMA1363]
MAELILLANPTGIAVHSDGTSLTVDFDSIADLTSWLHLAGLTDPDLLTAEHEGTSSDGRPYRSQVAYPTWHGWEFYAHAREYTDTAPLDPATADRLTALAVA